MSREAHAALAIELHICNFLLLVFMDMTNIILLMYYNYPDSPNDFAATFFIATCVSEVELQICSTYRYPARGIVGASHYFLIPILFLLPPMHFLGFTKGSNAATS